MLNLNRYMAGLWMSAWGKEDGKELGMLISKKHC